MNPHDILVLGETSQGAVAESTHELLGAARHLALSTGGQVTVVLLGDDVTSVAASLSTADRILAIEAPLLAAFSPQTHLDVLEALLASEQPRALLVGSTTVGLDIAPLVAAHQDAPLLKGCQKIEAEGDDLSVTCSLFGGKLLADVTVSQAPAILLLLPGCFPPADQAGRGQVETMPSPVPLTRGAIEFEAMILPEAGDVDITQQDILVAVGRGIQQEDDMEVAQELAEALGGELAGSRPVIDQGWLPPTRQVGKSGMIVKPKLYLALGISGAPEHQEGMQNADLIIAVNTDPNAPIFEIADYGTQLDLLDLAPALTEAVKTAKEMV